MTTLQDKLDAFSGSLSPDELAQVDAVAADAPPEDYPPEIRAKFQGVADQLSSAEREELLEDLAGDVDGFMISQDRVKQPGSGGEPPNQGAGFDPGREVPFLLGNGLTSVTRGYVSVRSRVSGFLPG